MNSVVSSEFLAIFLKKQFYFALNNCYILSRNQIEISCIWR